MRMPTLVKKFCDALWEYDSNTNQVYIYHDNIEPELCGRWISYEEIYSLYRKNYVSQIDRAVWENYMHTEHLNEILTMPNGEDSFFLRLENKKKDIEWHEVYIEKTEQTRLIIAGHDIRKNQRNAMITQAVMPEFDFVCCIDVETEQYVIYYSEYSEAYVPKGNAEKYSDILHEVNDRYIVPEQREEVTACMEMEHVIKELQDKEEYILYATMKKEGIVYDKRLRFLYADENRTKILFSRVDVSDIVREQKLRKLEEKKRIGYLENMPVAFCEIHVLVDYEGNPYDFQYLYSNKAHAELEGVEEGGLLGKNFYEIFQNENKERLKYYYETAYEGKTHVINVYRPEIGKHLTVHTFQTEIGKCGCVLVDVSETYSLTQELKKSREELKKQAQTDFLTGVMNAGTGKQMIKKKLLQQKEFNYNIMFLMDIDDFKSINDTKGHMEGDEVLKQFAWVLRSTFRSVDIIYRLGGDEFVVFIENICNPDILIEKMMFRFNENMEQVRKKYPFLTSSVGIYITGNQHSFEDYYTGADQALYQTKKKGKNHYTLQRD